MTLEQIAERLHCTLIQIRYACQAGYPSPAPRSGRPPSLSEAQSDELIAFVRQSKAHQIMTFQQPADGPFHHCIAVEEAIRAAFWRREFRRYVSSRSLLFQEPTKFLGFLGLQHTLIGLESNRIPSFGQMRPG